MDNNQDFDTPMAIEADNSENIETTGTDSTAGAEVMPQQPISEMPAPTPSKRIKVPLLLYVATVLIVAIACILATFAITRENLTNEYNRRIIAAQNANTKTEFQQKLEFIEQYVNNYFIKDYDLVEAEDAAVAAFFEALGDDYTFYLTAEEFAQTINDSKGVLYGIGVRAVCDPDSGYVYITQVMPDSPAQRAGLQDHDRITAVAGNTVTKENYSVSISNIKGEQDTDVVLTILRDGSTFDLTVTRGVVNTVTVQWRKTTDDIAVINIYEFKQTTPEQFKTAITEAQAAGCTKFIFDLRNCPGGNLDAIEDILDYLLPEGPIINIVYGDGTTDVFNSDAGEFCAPMAVLCNGDTASAGELFTAALRDYDKATIIGTTTFGKGSMQTYRQFSDGSGFRMSIAYYNPPCNVSYEGTGITPDITVELTDEQKTYFYFLTDAEDPQLQKAVETLNND